MDDEFELVSKAELKRLRENLAKQKTENIVTKNSSKDNKENTTQSNLNLDSNILEEFRKIIREENQKEKEQLIEDLTHLKDLNKSTLSNVLDRTDKLDSRIENLVDAISELVKTIHDLVEGQTQSHEDNSQEILNKISEISNNSNSQQSHQEIENKLKEIETFMNNLKILLSQIKPTDMTLN